MKKRHAVWLVATFSAAIFAACNPSSATFDESAHEKEVLDWRVWRIEQLKKPSGYLNQIGLFWLEPGTYRFGTADGNDVVFGGRGASEIGEFTVTPDGVSMTVASGVEVLREGEPVEKIKMVPDTSSEPTVVEHGSLAWIVVERVGRFAIRVRDFEHPFVAGFGPLPYYDIDPALRVAATLRRYPEPVVAKGETVIDGLDYRPISPGVVEFSINGRDLKLEAYTVDDRLFYVFGDRTNRDATYGAGRFLYSATPGDDGITVLDFNKAYSPPCAFNDFSTCPVASPRNRLPIRIEAGEKYDDQFHYSPEH